MSKRAAAAMAVVAGVLLSPAPAGAASDVCVAANGAVRTQHGTSACQASGTGSVAIAMNGSFASATGGDHNLAKAFGDHSVAQAGEGNNNTAIASGDNSLADALHGNNNTAIASGDNSFAAAGAGNNDTATATSPGCTALALGSGVSNSC